jgi:hypothetical protein
MQEHSGCWQQGPLLCGVLFKGEVAPVHTMKVNGKNGVQLHISLTLALDGALHPS